MEKLHTLVYLNNLFQDFELVGALSQMKRSGLFSLTYANGLEENGEVTGQFGLVCLSTQPVNFEQLQEFDALLIVGGQHCQTLRQDQTFSKVARHFFAQKKLVFAICDAPNVLFELGLITDSTPYTSYPIEPGNFGASRQDVPLVFDQNTFLLSARDPEAAFGFGRAIVRVSRRVLKKC